ncbi:MAG TPA: HD-GYP domain-containing protein [Gaiellaceae bacterium]|nr:HD-GYP domain-containing protein [Gaiellaceae bacterium]
MGDKSTAFVKLVRANLLIYGWAAALWLAAIVVALVLARDAPLPSVWVIAGLATLAAVAERQGVPVTGNTEASVAFLPLVFAAVAFGPFAALVVAALAGLGDLRRPYLRWAVYLPVRALTAAAAGLAAGAVVAPDGRTAFLTILLACLAASVVEMAADLIFNLGTQAVRRAGSPWALLRTLGPLILVYAPLYTPIVALLVYGYQLYSVAIVGAFLVPAIALQRLIHLYQQQREAVSSLEEANTRLERASLSFATALVATLDARDRYTAGHSAAVAIYSRDIAARMGLSDRDQQLVHLCGLVHDIGKVGLPAGLLEKPGALTLEERRQMEEHSAIGERILSKVADYSEIARIVRHHHERVDGLGYPDGLNDEDIPLLSRIISVADAYDAMTSDRPYRDAMPSRVARLRLAQAVESQFDTTVVAAFEAILAGAPEEYRTAARSDFDFEVQEEVRAPAMSVARIATA